jgi:hypothetical protein
VINGAQEGTVPERDPATPIRLTIESVAGEGWDGESVNTAFFWEPRWRGRRRRLQVGLVLVGIDWKLVFGRRCPARMCAYRAPIPFVVSVLVRA